MSPLIAKFSRWTTSAEVAAILSISTTLSIKADLTPQNISMRRRTFSEWVIASIGTDGSDFLPDVAGAVVDNHSLEYAEVKGMDVQSYLDGYDSNRLLGKLGSSLVITGDTGTNVGDVIVYLLS